MAGSTLRYGADPALCQNWRARSAHFERNPVTAGLLDRSGMPTGNARP